MLSYDAQNPLHTFLHNFYVDREVAVTWQQVIVMEFWETT